DIFTLSAHKFHGPKGIGAIYIKKGIRVEPVIFGGNQEFGLRSGTENVPGILGLGEAARLVKDELYKNIDRMKELKRLLYVGIEENIGEVKFNSKINENFAPHILNVSFKG